MAEQNTRSILVGVFALLTVVLLVTNIFFYRKLQATRQDGGTPQEVQAEIDTLISEVGALMVLPDEAPTVATVSDLEQLKNQPFFAQAKLGDKVLIYAVARKAILYSPTEKKIVEVAPLLIGETTPNTPNPSQPPTTTEATQ